MLVIAWSWKVTLNIMRGKKTKTKKQKVSAFSFWPSFTVWDQKILKESLSHQTATHARLLVQALNYKPDHKWRKVQSHFNPLKGVSHANPTLSSVTPIMHPQMASR